MNQPNYSIAEKIIAVSQVFSDLTHPEIKDLIFCRKHSGENFFTDSASFEASLGFHDDIESVISRTASSSSLYRNL
jgi:hypothetical protein